MNKMKKKMIWLLPGLLLLLADRAVKLLCEGISAPLIPGVIALREAKNTGMALGLFQGNTMAVLILSLVLIGACLWLLRGMRLSGWAPFSLSLMAGGALGNMIDRIAYGYVIDMFEFLFVDFYIFNVADVGVVCGAILCGASLLFRPQDWSKR